MTKLKTRPELLASLEAAARRTLSAAERHGQRVSFVASMLDGKQITREQIERAVAKQDGSLD